MEPLKIIDNRYTIISKLGEGGFATVFKAWAANLERFVAVKKINEDYSKDAKFLDMFRNEAINTAKLDHPNIVRVIDFLRTSQNVYYIIMEYVQGRDLRHLLQQCKKKNLRIPFGLCMYVICETLKALSYAYSLNDERSRQPLNIVHRDISPGNIMLYFDGRVKLTDFGIAKVSSKFGEKMKEGILRGKVAYMSPEQAGGTLEIDNRSDIFSTGVVLYELLTGKRLFYGKSDYEIWQMAKKAKIDLSIIEEAAHIPAPIKAILKKSLASNRDDRYGRAEDMIQDIMKFFGDSYLVQAEGLTDFLQRSLPEEINEEQQASQIDPAQFMQQNVQDSVQTLDISAQSVPQTGISQGVAASSETSEHLQVPAKEQTKPVHGEAPSDKEPAPVQPVSQPAQDKIPQGEKTVFDFVLDTARKHEKVIIIFLISLVLGAVAYVGFDIYKQITPFGEKVHGYIWPPALTIESFPSNSQVLLKKDNGELIVDRRNTPVSVDKLLPGNYTMIICKEGFRDIERRITVKGKDHIYASGSVYTTNNQKNLFLFPFEILLTVQSQPLGATVYIDGKKLPDKTPIHQFVEVGKHTVQLFLEGLEPLGSSDMIASYGQCWIDFEDMDIAQKGIDRRTWTFDKRMKGTIDEYVLKGMFWKSISVKTDPTEASVFVDNEKDERGKTPLTDIRLLIGGHRITVSKGGFKTEEIPVEINAKVNANLFVQLKKFIWFRAFDIDNNQQDLQASVTIPGVNIKAKTTPFRIALPLKKYSAHFEKDTKYEAQTIPFSVSSSVEVRAIMKMKKPILRISVKTDMTEEPIAQASIFVNGAHIGTTDAKGIWEGTVNPGPAAIKVTAPDRIEQLLSMDFKGGEKYQQEILLINPSNCTLYIDTRPYFIGAQIYIDGIYQNETLRKLSGLDMSMHTIRVRHFDLEEDIETTITFTSPNQSIKVKIDEKGKFVIKE